MMNQVTLKMSHHLNRTENLPFCIMNGTDHNITLCIVENIPMSQPALTVRHIPEHKVSNNIFYSVTGWCNNHALTVSHGTKLTNGKAIHFLCFQVKEIGTYKYEICNSHGKEYCCFKAIILLNTSKIYVPSEIRHCLLMPNNNVP